MSRIYVEFSKLDQVGNHCKSISSKVSTIQENFQHTVRNLDWDIRFASNIDKTATHLSQKLNQYSKSLEEFQYFIEDTKREYIKLDEYRENTLLNIKVLPIKILPIVGPGGQPDWKKIIAHNWEIIFKSFGSAGSIFGIVNSVFGAKDWLDWGNAGVDITKSIATIAKDYNKYNKIGRAIGTANSKGYFWRNFFGLNKVGYASKASSASARFYNNLHNTTSPYKLSSVFDSFTGKKGTVSSVASWAGLALSGIGNAFSNIEEQKESNGTMSTGRVVAETISETVIDTAISTVGSAVIGAGIAAVTGTVAAPVVVAAATGFAVAGINAGVKTTTGKTATEWISDTILDSALAVGNGIVDGTKAFANWMGKLSFT